MHGAGNDYIYVNTLKYPIDNPEHLSVLWSDRHKGIGGDGLVLIGKGAAVLTFRCAYSTTMGRRHACVEMHRAVLASTFTNMV